MQRYSRLSRQTVYLLLYTGLPAFARNTSFGLEACLQQPNRNLPQTQPRQSSLKDDDFEERRTGRSETVERNVSVHRGTKRFPDEKKTDTKLEDSLSLALQEEDFNLETHLHYTLYLPHLYGGPLLNFADFRLQVSVCGHCFST